MALSASEFENYSEKEINELVSNSIPESKTLDYKQEMYPWNDDGKREFLADVSAFANADGGLLFIGIKEESGEPVEVVGIELPDADYIKQLMENIIRDSIKPRLIGVGIKPVKISNGKMVVVINIHKSLNSPHVVHIRQHWRFYGRNSAGKYQLDVDELRNKFLAGERLSESIRNFRIERVQKIYSEEYPVPMEKGPKFILHIIPVSSFYENCQEIFQKNYRDLDKDLKIHSYNFDGVIISRTYSYAFNDLYIHLFRNGALEIVHNDLSDNSKKMIKGTYVDCSIHKNFPVYLSILKSYNFSFPVIVYLSITNVKDFTITDKVNQRNSSFNIHSFDRDILLLPELMLVEETQFPIDSFFESLFDPLWNACGYSQSQSFSNGKWMWDR